MPFERGQKQCKYLPQGSMELCNKSCYGDYCGFHNQRIKKGYRGPNPCLCCGVGMRGESSLCYRCGGRNFCAVLYYYKTRSPQRKIRKENPPSVEEYTEVV